ncbi:hydrogenase maturation nickel metallochaperone HypA [Tautonia rosea]|uniref:hydrogenase maturation nickel metallochaperone HypA n=1 Tax=Tautonia rosea TaxID=2728037 RepID=UPI00147641E2|nr:hydrogenase maturation nickel metallochaperone HypA [Tautonia rosea]
MHELSIAQALVQQVSEALEGSVPCRVTWVRLRIGAFSGVATEALAFCFEVVTRDTLLEGSTLEIESIPVAIRCERCQREVELPEAPPLRCPICDTPSAAIVRGKELEVESIEVEDQKIPRMEQH